MIFCTRLYRFSAEAHRDQKRASGEKYIVHSINVALILAEQKLDTMTIAAGLLHDVAEDTDRTIEDIRIKFGSEIAELVDGVTRISTYQAKTSMETKAEYFRKMFVVDGQRYPGNPDKAGRPAAQHAHSAIFVGSPSEKKCAGNLRGVRPDCASSGDGAGQTRVGGFVNQISP